MQIKSKYKIARRLGSSVFEKTQGRKYALRSERKAGAKGGKKSFRPMSDFAKALIEKQKARITYLLGEKQFAKYVNNAIKAKNQKPEEFLYNELETRLDSTAFKLGFSKTRTGAKQMVSHGHLAVNGKRVNVPSFKVSVGDKITPMGRSKDKKIITDAVEYSKEYTTPNWLSFDAKKIEGVITSTPKLVSNEVPFDLSMILDFYKR